MKRISFLERCTRSSCGGVVQITITKGKKSLVVKLKGLDCCLEDFLSGVYPKLFGVEPDFKGEILGERVKDITIKFSISPEAVKLYLDGKRQEFELLRREADKHAARIDRFIASC